MSTAYATLEVIPTVRSIRARIERQISTDLAAVGRKAGRDTGSAITSGIQAANFETTGRAAGTRLGLGLKATGAKAGRDTGSAITSGIRSANFEAAGRDAAGRFRAGFVAGGQKAGRDAGKAISDGVRSEDYESSGRSAAERIRNGFTSGIGGIGVGLTVATQGARLFVINASTIATTMSLAARVVRSFSAATFIAAVGLRQVASTGLVRLAGMLRIIAAIASRVAGEIGQITAAFLLLQAVVRVASMMTNFARKLAIATVGAATAIGVISGLGTMIGGALVSVLTAGALALGAFAGAAAGLGGPAIFALKIGFKGLTDAAGTFTAQFKDADDAFNTMVGKRMGPMLKAFRTMRMEMVDRFSKELEPAFQRVGVGIDMVRGKFGWMSVYLGQIGQGIGDSLTSPATIGAIQRIGDASGVFFQHLNKDVVGIGELGSGLLQFAATAATAFQDSSTSANDFFINLGHKLAGITPEQIRGALGQFRQVFENVGNVAMPLISLFRQMGQISAASLAPGFAAIGQGVRDATPGLVNMAQIIMPALGEVMRRLAPLIPALVQAFTPWASILATIAPPLATVVSHMAPLAPYLLMASTAFRVIGAAMLVWNAITFASSVAQGVFAAAMGRSALTLTGNTIALAAHRVALIAGAVAARAFGAAMTFATGPIGIIILAVTAIGVALWAFFTKTEVGKKWWTAIWGGIKTAVSATWEFLKVAWQWILTGLQWIGDKANWLWTNVFQPVFGFIGSLISAWWTNIVQPAFNGVKTAFEIVGNVISWWWNSIVTPAFTAVSAVISYFWDNVGAPIFHNFQTAIGMIGDAISAWWTGIMQPAFDAVGSIISGWWNNIVTPAFEGVKIGVGLLGDAFTFLKDNVVSPVFDGIGSAISSVWGNVVSPVFDKAKTGIGIVGEAFGKAGDVVKGAWSGIADALRPAIHALGGILAKVPSKIGPWEIPGAGIAQDLGNAMLKFRDGGLVSGAGTGTSDSIFAMLSNREFVVNALATGKNLPFLEAINAGWTPPDWLLDLMVNGLPGFAGGGLVDVQNFLRGEAGKKYQYGGTGNPSWDCSGIAGGAWAAATGKPTNKRYFTTDSDFAALGWQPGPGGPNDITIGTDGGSGTNGHMSGRTGDLKFESSGADGVEVGAGAQDPSNFPKQWHWPLGGNPLGGGLDTGGASTGGSGGLGSGGGSRTGGPGTSGGTSSSGAATSRPSGTAIPVWVDNMPSSLTSSSSASTAASDTTSVNGTADITDGSFDRAAAVNTALDKARGGFAKAGETALRGQLGATPFGGMAEGLEKTVNNLNVVVADVYEAINVWRREQARTAMAAGSRF
ncbi:hypothetical protein [Nocardia sp. NBC_01009]|uniref:phage tail protein n=1 Tax=Nocardia sp. NBC_01009 TaxID=2975996 RepID=UPI00386F053C|nr:hypothetical protein OHA42_04930 [Nocardia sp. NBC_01009]